MTNTEGIESLLVIGIWTLDIPNQFFPPLPSSSRLR